MVTALYNYTLKLNGEYISVFSEDSVFGVLKEHQGAEFISRSIVGYQAVMAD